MTLSDLAKYSMTRSARGLTATAELLGFFAWTEAGRQTLSECVDGVVVARRRWSKLMTYDMCVFLSAVRLWTFSRVRATSQRSTCCPGQRWCSNAARRRRATSQVTPFITCSATPAACSSWCWQRLYAMMLSICSFACPSVVWNAYKNTIFSKKTKQFRAIDDP